MSKKKNLNNKKTVNMGNERMVTEIIYFLMKSLKNSVLHNKKEKIIYFVNLKPKKVMIFIDPRKIKMK